MRQASLIDQLRNRSWLVGGLVLLGALLVVLTVGAEVTRAAETAQADLKEEITLSPAVEKIDAKPGQVKSGKFTVLNTGEKEFSFIVYARPYTVDNENYSPNYQTVTNRSNLYRWVQFDVTEGRLKPGESQKINYTIMVPRDAEAGGHYGVLFAETVADKGDSQVIARNKRVGSIVRLSVGGDIKRSGAVESQSIPWLQTRPPLRAEARLTNAGNIDFDAKVQLSVKTVFGRELYRSQADPVVYPSKPRQVVSEWADVSIIGLYRVEQTISLLDKNSQTAGYVLVVPRWALTLLAMAIVGGGAYAAYRRLR